MESLNTLITNSTFNTEHSMNGFHTLKLKEEEHKALKSIIAENEYLKENCEGLRKKLDMGTEEHFATMKKVWIFYQKKVKEFKEEIEKLKEENEKLNRKCLRPSNAAREKLKEENEKLKKELAEMTQFHEWDKSATLKWNEAKGELAEMKAHFNLIIELIKGCNTDEQLQKLKELNTLK